MLEYQFSADALHDSTFLGLAFEWSGGRAILRFRVYPDQVVELVSDDVRRVSIDRKQPWGPSLSVNAIRGPMSGSPGLPKVEIELQSGDLIVIEATGFFMRSD